LGKNVGFSGSFGYRNNTTSNGLTDVSHVKPNSELTSSLHSLLSSLVPGKKLFSDEYPGRHPNSSVKILKETKHGLIFHRTHDGKGVAPAMPTTSYQCQVCDGSLEFNGAFNTI